MNKRVILVATILVSLLFVVLLGIFSNIRKEREIIKSVETEQLKGVNITKISIKSNELLNTTYEYIKNNFILQGYTTQEANLGEEAVLLSKEGEFVIVGIKGGEIVIISGKERSRVIETWNTTKMKN